MEDYGVDKYWVILFFVIRMRFESSQGRLRFLASWDLPMTTDLGTHQFSKLRVIRRWFYLTDWQCCIKSQWLQHGRSFESGVWWSWIDCKILNGGNDKRKELSERNSPWADRTWNKHRHRGSSRYTSYRTSTFTSLLDWSRSAVMSSAEGLWGVHFLWDLIGNTDSE